MMAFKALADRCFWKKDLIKITAATQYTLFLVLQCSREGIYFTITFALPPKCLNLYIFIFLFFYFFNILSFLNIGYIAHLGY